MLWLFVFSESSLRRFQSLSHSQKMRFTLLRRGAVDAVKNYFHRDWNTDDILNFDEVSPFIRIHLNRFYFTLLCASVSSVVGSFLHPTGNFGCLFTASTAFLSFISFYLTAPWRENKRFCFLMLTAFFGWATATPWLCWLLDIDTGFVATIILAHCVGFACFCGSSTWTPSFEFVYFNALLLYIHLLIITMFVTATVFGGDSDHFQYLAYPYLLWCMAYVAAYSQEVVMKARRGDGDHVKHAICLYAHFTAFVLHLMKELWRIFRR